MNNNYPYDFDNKSLYNGDYLSNMTQDAKTSQNLETIDKLFDEWDEEDKSDSKSFTLNDQNYDSDSLSYNYEENTTSTPSFNSSFYDEPSKSMKVDRQENNWTTTPSYNEKIEADPLDQTREIDSVDLAELKAIQAELHRLYDEPAQSNVETTESPSQSKGKSLVKATKQGIAFSNGSLTRTFLDCAVLCFVTASMGVGFLMNIISHL